MPKKIITIIIQCHGEDIVEPAYKIPLNVRILSAAGIPGCFNFGSGEQRKLEEEIARSVVAMERMKPDFTTYRILDNLRGQLKRVEEMRGYEGLNDIMDHVIERTQPSSRYIPLDESSFKIAKKRTEEAIFSRSRYKIIKSTTQHKYSFVPKSHESEGLPDGIYVIDSINNPDSLLKFGDNLAERKFDINEQGLTLVPVSSIHDIRYNHINYVRRKFGPYLGLASLYNDGDTLSPFESIEEVDRWVTDNYKPVDNIYRLGCMKLFATGTKPRELKALMCATFLGEKYYISNKSNRETDIFTAILNRLNILSEEQKPKFKTGLSPDEFDKILSKYNVSSNPDYVGAKWESIRNTLIELYTSSGISNTMLAVPNNSKYDSENIEETYISQVVKYLKGLGYDGINIVDFSCRVNKHLSAAQLKEDEAKEDLSPRAENMGWGKRPRRGKRTMKRSKENIMKGKNKIRKTRGHY
jgi:hypothetical protein